MRNAEWGVRNERVSRATCTGPSRSGIAVRVAESEAGAERMNGASSRSRLATGRVRPAADTAATTVNSQKSETGPSEESSKAEVGAATGVPEVRGTFLAFSGERAGTHVVR